MISFFCPQTSCNAEKPKTTTKKHLQNQLPKCACLLKASANYTLHNSHLVSSKAKITVFSAVTHSNYFISKCLLLLKNSEVQRELHEKRKVQRELLMSRLISFYVRLVKIMKHFSESKFD